MTKQTPPIVERLNERKRKLVETARSASIGTPRPSFSLMKTAEEIEEAASTIESLMEALAVNLDLVRLKYGNLDETANEALKMGDAALRKARGET